MKALILLSLPLAVVWGSGCSTGNGNDPVSAAQSPKITQSETSAAEPCETCDSEEEVAVADLPAAVSAAALSAVPGGTIVEAERETEAGVVVYEVEVETAAGEFEVEVSEAGEVLEVEAEDEDDEDDDD